MSRSKLTFSFVYENFSFLRVKAGECQMASNRSDDFVYGDEYWQLFSDEEEDFVDVSIPFFLVVQM